MATSSDIRKLFKAFHQSPDLHAQVRAANTPAEKHAIIRNAGHTPVTDQEVQAELAKALPPATPEDQEFVGHVMHLAAADSAQANDA